MTQVATLRSKYTCIGATLYTYNLYNLYTYNLYFQLYFIVTATTNVWFTFVFLAQWSKLLQFNWLVVQSYITVW